MGKHRYTVNAKGHRIHDSGSTEYYEVNKDVNGLFWAVVHVDPSEYDITGARTNQYEIGVFKEVIDAADAIKEFYKDRDSNIKALKRFGRAKKVGEGWAYNVPVVRGRRSGGHRVSNTVVKNVVRHVGITEETVERQVNALLGPSVKVQARIAIKDIVVANVEFYRTTSDVTAYVNDLVTYIVR